ncbi:hypothetical protein [Frateuria defendens]|uniref:hypothetical protein n=1 Tax=Frateuria defendens TaxID=2219559 RepID=UPI001293C1EE|nr:hypothetical protein [Frateuria defendens]
MMQTDLSSNANHKETVSALLSGYQAWAPKEQQFNTQEIASLSERLNKGGQTGNA